MRSHHDFKIVDYEIRRSYSYDDQTTANVRREIENAKLALISFEAETDTTARAEALAAAFNALQRLDNWLPPIPDTFVCGYWWGRDSKHWSGYTAHATREEAELWLPWWQQEIPTRDEWTIEQRPSRVLDFVKGGPPA